MTQSYSAQTELGHLSAGISAGATSITLVSGEGAQFDTDLPYDIMIGGDGGETVSLTAIATDTLTISATAGAWAEGTAVFMIATLSQPRTSGQLALVADLGASAGPGGSDPQVQYNSSGTFGGAANVTIDADDIVVGEVTTTTPASPSAGSKLFSLLRAGRNSFMTIGAAGDPQGYAPDWLTQPRIWSAGSANTPDTTNSAAMGTINGGGSALSQAPATTNYLTQFQRLRHSTSASANQHAGWRATFATVFTSTTANMGGFFWQARFSIHTHPSTARYFVGMYGTSSNIPMNAAVEPSTFLNCAGFMVDSSDSNFYWGTNDGTGTCTRTSITGATMTGDTYQYVASICAFPGSTDIYYALEQYDTSGTFSLLADSVSTTDTPAANTLLYDYVHGTPSTASTLSIDISCVVLQRWR